MGNGQVHLNYENRGGERGGKDGEKLGENQEKIERNWKKLKEKQENCCHQGGFTVFYLMRKIGQIGVKKIGYQIRS